MSTIWKVLLCRQHVVSEHSADIADDLINETLHLYKYVIESDRYNTMTRNY